MPAQDNHPKSTPPPPFTQGRKPLAPPAPARPTKWTKIGGNTGGVVSFILLIPLGMWRRGIIAIIVYTLVFVVAGSVIGAGIDYLLRRKK